MTDDRIPDRSWCVVAQRSDPDAAPVSTTGLMDADRARATLDRLRTAHPAGRYTLARLVPAGEPATGGQLVALSRWIDDSAANRARDTEALTWQRIAKVAEEAGEVVAALIACTGGNPRKPPAGCPGDVEEELLDVAVTALAAVEHLRGHDGRALSRLTEKVARVHARAVGGAR